MIIYWPDVYTFNGYFSEEDLQMFWVYRYKGFSFTAARTVHTALDRKSTRLNSSHRT